jgi:3' exoribonuclease, RNase T-like
MSNEIRVIAGLDIETLSLEQDAVVFQIGVATETFIPPTTYPVPPEELAPFAPQTRSIGLEIMYQLMDGRSVSKDTMDFHRKVATKHGLDIDNDPVVRGIYFHQAELQKYTATEARDVLFKLLSGVQEVWINHPEFDLPRLKGALRITEANPLFDFRKVRDIATIRNSGISIPKIENPHKERHDAVHDATWNLQVALAWHHRVHQINHLESSLIRLPATNLSTSVTPLTSTPLAKEHA